MTSVRVLSGMGVIGVTSERSVIFEDILFIYTCIVVHDLLLHNLFHC